MFAMGTRESQLQLQGTRLFSEFFSEYHKWEYDKDKRKLKPIAFGKKAWIGNYLQLRYFDERGFKSIEVMPTEKLINVINSTMMPFDYDQIDYELIIYTDNTAMLVCRYNQIIGSRWIAMIDVNSIPEL